ncbi:hypothetical protein AAHC03_02050 [Spirometra sp. Aus1]
MQKEPLQSIVNPSNSTIRELELLDLESSLLSSSNLPVLTVKANETPGDLNGPLNRLQLTSTQKDPWIHLIPHSDALKDNPKNVVYNYLYIPRKKKRSKATSSPQLTSVDVACDRNDLKTEIAQEAKREASVLQQISKLARQGLWSATRLPKVMEPHRGRVHWDFLLDEARWMATDFAEERKWKKQTARKLVYSARAFCLMKQELQRRDDEALERERRKGAAVIARIVRQWWDSVSSTVETWVLLANQRRWRSTLVQNKNNIAALTDLGPTWLARAVNDPLPDSFDLDSSPNAGIGCLSEPEDADWKPPSVLKPIDQEESVDVGEMHATSISTTNSSSSCSRVASFESLVDAGDAFSDFHCPQTPTSPFSCEKFTWGLPRTFPPPSHHRGGGHSQAVSEATERVTDGLCTSPSPQSTPSSPDSSLSTDKEEVQELEADGRLLLEHVLEPYILNGWSPCGASTQPKRPLLESVLSTLPLPVELRGSKEEHFSDTGLEDECANSLEDHRGRQSTVDILRYEASVPLAQVLPPGYQSAAGPTTVNDENRINTSSDNQSVPARQLRSTRNSRGPSAAATVAKNALLSPAPRVLRRAALHSGLVNGLPPHEKHNFVHLNSSQNDGPITEVDHEKTSSPSPDISSLDSDLTMETEIDSDDGNESINSVCSSNASNQTVGEKPDRHLTVPPWYQDQCGCPEQQQQLTPKQLRRLALEMASLKRARPPTVDWPRLLPSFGPICRIPFLPTTSHYSAVAWLHASYNRRTPACLLSPMPSSSDAELTLAAHLGQLAVLRPDSSSSASSSPPSSGPTTGDWGPHLIVCPHVLLPAWRNRLAYFCPGLRVVCIAGGAGSGSANGEPAGTGRRLRRSITRGQVNICLTSFAALRSRPSRYSSIKWSLVILDQAQHLTSVRCPSACATDDENERPLSRSDRPLPFACNQYSAVSTQPAVCSGSEASSLGDVQRGGAVGASSPLDCRPASADLLNGDAPLSAEDDALTHTSTAASTTSSTLPELVELIIESLSSARQRILIYSADLPVGLSHVRTLFHLLLTSANPTEAILKETANLVGLPSIFKTKGAFTSAAVDSSGTGAAASTNHLLSRNEVVKMLDPFIFRFEEDEEWDLFVKERIVSCSLSEPQRVIHDLILRDKSCERAVKSGNLVDLLTTMSAGVGACVHPCLSAGSAVSQPKLFQVSLAGLLEDASPPPGPLRFPLASRTAAGGLRAAGFGGNPLSFCTTSDVLTAVRQLRAEQEQPLYLSSALSLCSAVHSPKHLRQRLIELLPQPEDLEGSRPSAETAPNRTLSEDPVVKSVDQSLLLSISSENRPNGVLKRHPSRNAKDALNSAVLRSKRIRLADCNGGDYDEPTPEDVKRSSKCLAVARSTGLPFISSELLEMILLEESAHASVTRRALKLEGTPQACPTVATSAFNSSPVKNKLGLSDALETAAANGSSISTDARLAHNLAIQKTRIMCMQEGVSDWCSSLTCECLLIPTVGETMGRQCNTHVAGVNDKCGSCIWNVVEHEFNDLVRTGPSALSNLLCVRDAVVATPPLLKTCLPQVPSPDPSRNPLLMAVAEKIRPFLQCLLPFLPSSRWLSRSASSHPRFALSFTASSGKLVALQNLLKDLISGESPPDVSDQDTNNNAHAWLASHPIFSALTHLRLPSDHLDATAELNSCLERGEQLAARLPRLRTWALNGLVDAHSPPARYLMAAKRSPTTSPPPTLLQVYRLVTEADTRGSIEACLSETAAVRLLPGSVFMTASPATAARAAAASASAICAIGRPLSEPLLNQAFEMHEAPQDVQALYSSLAENMAVTAEFHDCSACSRHPRHQYWEGQEFSDYSLTRDLTGDLLDHHALDGCEFWAPASSHQQTTFTGNNTLAKQMGITDMELWEVGHFDVEQWAEDFNRLVSETPDIVSFKPLSSAESAADASSMPEFTEPGECDLPLFDLQRLPLWLPPRFEDAPLLGDHTLPAEGNSAQWPSMAEDESLVNFLTSAAVTPWGYSPEAMAEEDLPAVSVPPPAAAAFCTTAVGTTVSSHHSPFMFDLDRRARVTMSSTSSPLKRSAAAATSLGIRGAGGTFSAHRASGVGGLTGLKRRRLTGAAAAAVAARLPTNAKSSVLDNVPTTKDGELSAEADVALLSVAPSSPLPASAVTSSAVGAAAAAAGVGASSVGSGAGQSTPSGGGGMQPLVISLSPSMSSSCPHLQRLEVPRPFYLRDLHTRPPRLRRSGGGALAAGGSRQSGGSGALASGCSSAQSVLSNPSLLAKYAALPQNPALLTAGRGGGGGASSGTGGANQRQGGGSNALGMVAFKFGASSGLSQTTSVDSSNQLSSGGLSTGRPPEWSLYEEAGLFQCVAKLQNIPLGPPFQNSGSGTGASSGTSAAGAHQSSSITPNFNLAEFFLNNYLPTRVYRSCRQCLLAFYKSLATISAATTAMESAAAANICDHFGEVAPLEKPSLSHSASVHHGLTGRKVKNKLKSSLSSSSLTSLSATGNPMSLGSASVTGDSLNSNKQHSGPGTSAFAASATISRLKGYQFYQYLQSLVEPVVDVPTLKLSANLGSLSPSPQQLSQVLSAVNVAADNQSSLLRKCMLAALSSAASTGSTTASTTSPATVSAPPAQYRTAAASAGLSSASASSSPVVTTTSAGQQHHHPHHYSSILMHRSQHHQHHGGGGASPAGGSFSSSTGPVSTASVGSSAGMVGGSSGVPSGPVIQKNPTHIAALQEHNISPDTLITPAMVPTAKPQGQFSAVASVGSSLLPTSSSSTGVAGATVGTGTGVSISSAISVRPTAQRSPGILPFSTASAFGNLHLSSAGSLSVSAAGAGTVLRYATPGTINVSTLGGQHKLLHHQSTGGGGGGLLRRVGPVDFVQSSAGTSGSSHQQLYTVSNATTGAHGAAAAAGLAGASASSRWLTVEHLGGMSAVPARVSSFLPANTSEMVAACSGCHVLSANIVPVTASMIGRRSVTLTAATPGSSPGAAAAAAGISFGLTSGSTSPPISSSGGGGGLTVLASARSIGVGSTSPVGVYHQATNSSQGGVGVTLLTGGGQMTTSVAAGGGGGGHLSQIIRPRHPIRGTSIAHKFVRTLSTAGSAENVPFQRGVAASGPPLLGLHTAGGAVVHRTSAAAAAVPKDGSAVYHQQTIRSQSTDHLNSSNFIPLATRQRLGGPDGSGAAATPVSSQRVVSDHRVFSSHLHSMGQQQNPRQSGGPPVRRPPQQPTFKQATSATASQYSVLFPQRRQCSPSQSSEHNQKQT